MRLFNEYGKPNEAVDEFVLLGAFLCKRLIVVWPKL